MARDKEKTRTGILESASELICSSGAPALTVENTARHAGVAKGLVHYHFKTKSGLLKAVLQDLSAKRCANWTTAFDADTAKGVIEQTWKLLTDESQSGVFRAWHSLLALEELLADSVAKESTERFNEAVGPSLARMLEQKMDLAPTIPASELGILLVSVVNGTGQQMLAGVNEGELEGAYAAAWLGILSLTEKQN
jgi:TetR/AcrR family acrAB operon transcriptional repressor